MKLKDLLISILCLCFINSMFASDHTFTDNINTQNVSIKILTKDIKSGQSFYVKVSGADKMKETAWLGIFKPNLNPKNASGYESYVYLKDQKSNGSEMTAPIQTGEYEIRLYDADPGNFVMSVKFNVATVSPDQYKITVLTDQIKTAQTFKVNITTTYKMSAQSWLGIFKANHDPSAASGYLSYKYISQEYGEDVTLTAPSESGDYELRFYSADPGILIDQVPLRIGQPNLPGIAFNLNKTSYDPGEEIIVNYVGHQDLTESSWIGVFKDTNEKKYNKYLDYHYLKPKTKGQLIFQAPSIKGKYNVRMFYAETGPELLAPVSFAVTSSLDDTTIKKTLNEKGKVILYGIYFDTDRSDVKKESYPLLQEIAKMLTSDSSIKIQIEGHTDSQGDNAYNQNLSQKRAEAVLAILSSQYNVNKAQLKAKGFGETKPIGDNNTASGRAKNRRVELKKI